MSKKYLYFIHHSHTDIGYTESQERTLKAQAGNIADVVRYIDDFKEGFADYRDFTWNCESFVAVERFLESGDEVAVQKFKQYIKEGYIDLSASYANMTEIIHPEIYGRMVKRAVSFGKSFGYDVRSAMTADVNAIPVGFAEQLTENGVGHLYACVHTHQCP